MRSRATIVALLAGLLIAAGCATPQTLKFNGAGGAYAARTAADQIQVFDKDPGGKPYQTIGNLEWHYVSNTVLVTQGDVLPQLKAKAAEAGGDGIIVRRAAYDGAPNANKPFHVSADVIRWNP